MPPNLNRLSIKIVSAVYAVIIFFISISAYASNSLLNNASAYLAMHANDPVDWQEWDSNIVSKAKKSNKLILLSSGYFSCHWCHVMQKENYKDIKIATYLNKHYINVKIDRELSPALDKYMIDFSEKVTGRAGWPQHVVLTPQGTPVVAFGYQPNKQFFHTIQKIVFYWKQNQHKFQQLAESFLVKKNLKIDTKLTLKANEFQSLLLKQIDASKDDISGGIGNSKFPNAPIISTVLRIDKLPEDINYWLKLTLDKMATQHLYDHINGGFFRYTVDPEWQKPHFEKMLYTQAQMIEIYLLAYKRYKKPQYLAIAMDTYEYSQQHLFNKRTQLYQTSESAVDFSGREGGSYIFNKDKLKKLLTPKEYKIVFDAWRLDKTPPFDNGWLPTKTGIATKTWQKIKSKLSSKKIPKDNKSVLAWNSLMLSAITQLAEETQSQKIKQHSKNLKLTLIKWLQAPKPPRALSFNNEPNGKATLEEYAYLVRALKTFPQDKLTNRQISWLKEQAKQKFLISDGWVLSQDNMLSKQYGQWVIPDGAIPSPSSPLQYGQKTQLAKQQEQLKAAPIVYPTTLDNL